MELEINLKAEYEIIGNYRKFSVIEFDQSGYQNILTEEGNLVFPYGFVADTISVEPNNNHDMYLITIDVARVESDDLTYYYFMNEKFEIINKQKITNIISQTDNFNFNSEFAMVSFNEGRIDDFEFDIIDRNGNIVKKNENISKCVNFCKNVALLYAIEIDNYYCILNRFGKSIIM